MFTLWTSPVPRGSRTQPCRRRCRATQIVPGPTVTRVAAPPAAAPQTLAISSNASAIRSPGQLAGVAALGHCSPSRHLAARRRLLLDLPYLRRAVEHREPLGSLRRRVVDDAGRDRGRRHRIVRGRVATGRSDDDRSRPAASDTTHRRCGRRVGGLECGELGGTAPRASAKEGHDGERSSGAAARCRSIRRHPRRGDVQLLQQRRVDRPRCHRDEDQPRRDRQLRYRRELPRSRPGGAPRRCPSGPAASAAAPWSSSSSDDGWELPAVSSSSRPSSRATGLRARGQPSSEGCGSRAARTTSRRDVARRRQRRHAHPPVPQPLDLAVATSTISTMHIMAQDGVRPGARRFSASSSTRSTTSGSRARTPSTRR